MSRLEEQFLETIKSASDKFSDDMHPILLFRYLKDKYDKGWLDWTPETLKSELPMMSNINRGKVHALAMINIHDIAWNEWDVFEKCGQAFNGNYVNFGIVQPLSPGQCAFTIRVMDRIDDRKMGSETLSYIASILYDRGYVYAPPELFDETQTHLEIMQPSHIPEMVKHIKKVWKKPIVNVKENDIMHTQILRLQAVKLYIDEKDGMLNEQS